MQKDISATLCGIDYGSKLAGTTVVCACQADALRVQVWQSAPKQDADAFLKDWLEVHRPVLAFIDAPLSLPKLYKQMEPSAEGDFFYRQGDRALGAMSPLFLGGLTARAMRLQALVRAQGIVFHETYPAQQAMRLGLDALAYKKDSKAIPAVLEAILQETPFAIDKEDFDNWHRIDALLALTGAYRYAQGQAKAYGEAAEGQIWI
jgi:predicted nuclease with RNAse H fold